MRLHPRFAVALALVPAALVFAAPRTAHAGIEACNNIDVRANAQCKLETQGGCTAQCTPVRFEAACAGELQTTCSGQCTATATADCTTSCKGECNAQCTSNPGSLDCSANCKGSCEADCSGQCSSSGNKSECEASCKANCSGSCDAQCKGTPPSASCDAKCEASCKGSCTAEVNAKCQIDCQSKGYVQCKSRLEGGCKTQCTQPKGALFCDGQYVDTGNNLDNCIAALNAILNIKVDASGSASCTGNNCEAEGQAKASCGRVASSDVPETSALWIVAGLSLAGAAAVRRRKKKS
jgi:MYXO-CTERM domain-containing protein